MRGKYSRIYCSTCSNLTKLSRNFRHSVSMQGFTRLLDGIKSKDIKTMICMIFAMRLLHSDIVIIFLLKKGFAIL